MQGPHVFTVVLAVGLMASLAEAQTRSELGLHEQPTGWYISGSGMFVHQLDTNLTDSSGGAIDAALAPLGLQTSDFELDFDDGLGLRIAIGYSIPETPFSVELEYSYRTTSMDSITIGGVSVSADGDADTNAFMVNGMFDTKFGYSELGFYVGAGIGAALNEADLRIGGIGLEKDDDTVFAWQVFGGLTYPLTDELLLYGGVRYFSAKDVQFALLGGDNESVSFEIGIRFYF